MKQFIFLRNIMCFGMIIIVACAPHQEIATPQQNPPNVEPTALPLGCGDGICDSHEQADPALCPADCPADLTPSAHPPSLPETGTPDYEPPINVFIVLHIDPIGDLGMETFVPETFMFDRVTQEIDWLMHEADRHNLHYSVLYNGWFTKWALDNDQLDQFANLVAEGHELGSHAHQITYDPQEDLWVTHNDVLSIFGRPNYDPYIARQSWKDADQYLELVLDRIDVSGQNKTMCSTALALSDEPNLMAEFGFEIAAGNRLEAGINYLGHMPWNPWRAATSDEPGYEVAEDLSAHYVSINHGAQIGHARSHSTGVTLPALQRQFLELYIEWLFRERTGTEDRIWSFGFVYHPNQGDEYNADLVIFLEWLDQNFINTPSPYGNVIARYSTIGQIADEFYAWEIEHPGVSSFNYVDGNPYPYTFAPLAEKLREADYEQTIDLGPSVACYQFSRQDTVIYVLWSLVGAQTIDFSSVAGAQARITWMNDSPPSQSTDSLFLDSNPIVIEILP